MSTKTARIIRLVTAITLSVLIVITGLLLILSCISIYQSGNRPFTPENIGRHFVAIQIPVYITLGAIVTGLILHLCLPRDTEKKTVVHDRRAILTRIERRVNPTDADYARVAQKERTLRRVLYIAAPIVAVLLCIPFTIHLFTYGFTEDYNASVIAAMPSLLVASFGTVAIGAAVLYLRDASLAHQTDAAKQAIARDSVTPTVSLPSKKDTCTVVFALRIGIIAVALVLLVMGILNGGMADVLDKAINICTECIGLG
ncbi:MAG: hypothetical protein IJX80_01495 [Clostridia bacterium]|nr:hypothetical protein [Clostridia bacterium]